MKQREIKCRAWDERTKTMYFIDGIGCEPYFFDRAGNEATGVLMTAWRIGADLLPLMLFTGLKDKNDVEIYESDIVRLEKFGEGVFNREVKIDKWGVYPFRETTWSGEGGAEVIGNVHENPGLLTPPEADKQETKE